MARRSKRSIQLHYEYGGLVLDDFQQEAIWNIENDTSLLVSAPTGTGKTLIADFLIDHSLKNNQRVIYTAPIKALVNQKYQDFSRQFGRKNLGIATGDLTIAPNAPVLIVTTEVFRNMLIRRDPRIDDLQWVIFDEIHYLDHRQRGAVWEQSILLKPSHVRLLGLSATVPNIETIAQWIEEVHNEPVAVVTHTERAVPLRHLYFNQACEAIPQDKVMESLAEVTLGHSDAYDFKGGSLTAEDIQLPRQVDYEDTTRFMDLVFYLGRHRLFPALFFSFSRRGCEIKAKQTANRRDYLDAQGKRGVHLIAEKRLRQLELKKEEIPHYDEFLYQWLRGVGVHHAGLLPIIKQIAEDLLAEGLIRILFTTETFAVGVNMPVRTVCFDSLRKYDGEKFRLLTQQEYFQMAGRAGRRGMDRQGTVLSLVDFKELAKNPLPEWNEERLEPITSKFALTYNLLLNLLPQYGQAGLTKLFSKTLSAHQAPHQVDELVQAAEKSIKILNLLGFWRNSTITEKGLIGQNIYVQELLLTEALSTGYIQKLNPTQLAGLAASVSWESSDKLPPRPGEPWLTEFMTIRDQMANRAGVSQEEVGAILPAAAEIMMEWAEGIDFWELLKDLPLDPGDFVQLCRRSVDILRQLQSAADHDLNEKLETAIQSIDRGVAQTRF
jgi:superfamily II RNA helicase